MTNGRPLFVIGQILFKKYDLLTKFNIDRQRLSNFLCAIENGYSKTNPYHNSSHAADVAQMVHFFLHHKMRDFTTDVEIFSLIVASLIHDYDHPGKNNQFHIASQDPKSILYNDKSILENHHIAQSFMIITRDENNIFSGVSSRQYSILRRNIIDLVLATDMGCHFDFLSQFKNRQSSGSLVNDPVRLKDVDQASDRSIIHKMALKCADLGHTTKPLLLHQKWTLRIIEEFYRQGDEEKKLKLPISPFMDRSKANVPHSQSCFLDYLVIPMFETWITFLQLDPNDYPIVAQLLQNNEHWKGQQEIKTV